MEKKESIPPTNLFRFIHLLEITFHLLFSGTKIQLITMSELWTAVKKIWILFLVFFFTLRTLFFNLVFCTTVYKFYKIYKILRFFFQIFSITGILEVLILNYIWNRPSLLTHKIRIVMSFFVFTGMKAISREGK